MKVKRVLKYYCEFCKKSGCSKFHMAKHEKHCTMNPNRVCGMCAMMGDIEQPDLAELKALLPIPKDYLHTDDMGSWYNSGLDAEIEKAMPTLREKTENCPACIMAALRQNGIPIGMVNSFKFKDECKKWLEEFNEANRD